MSDDESFVARWSRRKHDAAPQTRHQPKSEEAGGGAAPEVSAASPPGETRPPPDPASLPPIESIGAEADIRAFLAAGVPADLARAALRRAWSADPVIRDFIGLSENSWDFNAPDGIFGFGSLAPEDIQRLTHVFEGMGATGEAMPMSAATTSSNESKAQTAECPPSLEQLQTKSDSEEKRPSDLAQQHHADSAQVARADGAAIPTERSAQGQNLQQSSRRRHGGALPRIGS